MTTEHPAERVTRQPADDPADGPSGTGPSGTGADPQRAPDWWHRDHPTFTALSGFFTGLVFVIAVPGLFAAVLTALFDYHTAEELFPLVLVILAVPLGLVTARRTRRFGLYMVIGMVVTLVIVAGVTALVLWWMIRSQA